MVEYFNRLFKGRSFKWGRIVHHLFDTMACQCIDTARPGHPINDHHQMANVDVRTVERKDSVYFFQECRSCCFHSVGGPNGKDVVTLCACLVDGLQLFKKVQIDPFCVDDKLLPLCSDAHVGNVFGTLDGGVQYHFGILEKVVFGAHVQMDILYQVVVISHYHIFPNGPHPRDNVLQRNVVLDYFFPTQSTMQHVVGRVTPIPSVIVGTLQIVQQLWSRHVRVGLMGDQIFDTCLLDLSLNFPSLFWS